MSAMKMRRKSASAGRPRGHVGRVNGNPIWGISRSAESNLHASRT